MDNRNIREDVELDNVVALLTFENGLTILDVPETYRQADESILISAHETGTLGWSIGGSLMALCLLITAVVICIICYKLSSCCLPVLGFFRWAKTKPQHKESTTGPSMEMAIMDAAHTLEMGQYTHQSSVYPDLDTRSYGRLLNTGGGVTPGRATAPVDETVIGDNLATRPGVGTSRV
jgi:hypothetical protein